MTAGAALDLVIPRGLKNRTGGFIYDRRIVEQLGSDGWQINVHELDPGFPLPSRDALRETQVVFARIPAGRPVVVDGLALGGMPAIVERESSRLRLIALIHHPLALETGLADQTAQQLRAAERRALAAVSRIIVTSRHTALALADYAVTTGRIRVVNPGADPAPLAKGSGGNRLRLLCVATLIPRKGHRLLVEALAGLRRRNWQLICAGSELRDPDTAAAVRRQITQCGLDDRVSVLGELRTEDLNREYAQADAFVLASHYEGYGMVLTEALARGLPIIATAGGAVPETVPAGAGLLVPPGDSRALREALARLIDDSDLRMRLRANARRARQTLPTWKDAGDRFAAAVREVVAE